MRAVDENRRDSPNSSVLERVGATRLGAAMTPAPVEPGSDVVVLGAGPVGLPAIQGARIMGAAQIIAVEPIRVRRELAMKVGATLALDPNVEGDGLVEKRDAFQAVADRTTVAAVVTFN